MFDIFKKDKCNHNYVEVGVLPCTCKTGEKDLKVDAFCYECAKCGKRKLLKEDDMFYRQVTLDMFKLWEKHQLDFDFNSWHNDRVDNNLLEIVLNQIKEQLKSLKLEKTEENRITMNNINAIINNALTEEI